MKLKSLNIYSFPVRAKTDWLILELISTENIKGYSEITMSNYDQRSLLIKNIKMLIKTLSVIEIKDDNQIKTILEINKKDSLSYNTAISGLRSACSDIFSKIKNVPMNEYLSDKYKIDKPLKDVELYANINRSLLPNNDGPVDRSPQSFLKMAKRAKDAGFKRIKCAPFDGFSEQDYKNNEFISKGIDNISIISKKLSGEVEALVDCHSKFDLEDSLKVGKKLFSLGINWFEEPMNPIKNSNELKIIKSKIDGKLVGGEEFYGVRKFCELIKKNILDIVMPDVKYCGGLEEAIKIGLELKKVSKECFSIHCPSGPISLAGSAHVTSALSSKLPLEHAVFELDDRSEFVLPNEKILKGKYILNNNIGIGVVPNFSKKNKILLQENIN